MVSVCFVIDLVALAAAQQVVVGGRTDGRTEAQAVAAAKGIFSNARLCFVLVLFSRLFPLLCRKLCCNPSPVAGVPLVCLSFSRMLFAFVSGKTFVPAFQGGGKGRAGGPESRLQGRVGVMYTLGGGKYLFLRFGFRLREILCFEGFQSLACFLLLAVRSPGQRILQVCGWLLMRWRVFFLCRSWDGWCQSISGVFCRSIIDRHQVCFLDLEDFLCCTRVCFLVDVFL